MFTGIVEGQGTVEALALAPDAQSQAKPVVGRSLTVRCVDEHTTIVGLGPSMPR
jgi:riboflavin synthase alpha subunit